jgi:hypothetical protein
MIITGSFIKDMKIRKYILTFLMATLLCCFSYKSQIEQIFETKKVEEYLIPFIITKNYRIFLEGVFKDSTYHFFLDNGFPVTCLCQKLFTRYYDMEKLTINVLCEDGGRICVVPNQIKFADYEFVFDTVNVDCHKSNLKRKEFSNVRGVIGSELFHRHIIELNFEDSLLIIRNQLPKNISEYISFDLQNFEHYAFPTDSLFRQIEISGFYDHKGNFFTGRFWIDLGTPTVTFLKTIREQTDLNYSKQDTNTLASFILNSGVVVENVHFRSGSASGKYLNDPELRIGHGILGTAFFANFHVIFDYPNNKLYLKRNKLTCKFKIY